MKNLVKLSVYDLSASNVQRIAVSLSKARDGGVPLLTELSCDVAKYWMDHAADIYPDTVLGVSKLFPELEVLRLCGFAAPVLGRSEYPLSRSLAALLSPPCFCSSVWTNRT